MDVPCVRSQSESLRGETNLSTAFLLRLSCFSRVLWEWRVSCVCENEILTGIPPPPFIPPTNNTHRRMKHVNPQHTLRSRFVTQSTSVFPIPYTFACCARFLTPSRSSCRRSDRRAPAASSVPQTPFSFPACTSSGSAGSRTTYPRPT